MKENRKEYFSPFLTEDERIATWQPTDTMRMSNEHSVHRTFVLYKKNAEVNGM